MNRIFIAAAAMAACLTATAADPYKVQAPVGADADGAMAFIINYDTGDKVDSVLVSDGVAVFKGNVDEPFLARLIVDGDRYAQFILESGSIAFKDESHTPFGSPLNDLLGTINGEINPVVQQIYQATDSATYVALEQQYNAIIDKYLAQNKDNPVGYLLFLQQAYDLEPAALEAYLQANPEFARYKRLQKLVEMNRRKAATSVGAKYLDFDIDGRRLSQYVGRDGNYLLVDFWASWCGPCMRQLPVLKEIYNKYHGKGLDVLGVAVWDEPDDTRRAITAHELPWDCIIGARDIPTDIYGISGIPCIMLIGPDGTILVRDLQGDELKAAVDSFLAK